MYARFPPFIEYKIQGPFPVNSMDQGTGKVFGHHLNLLLQKSRKFYHSDHACKILNAN